MSSIMLFAPSPPPWKKPRFRRTSQFIWTSILEWVYTPGRAERLLEYIRGQLAPRDEIEFWRIWQDMDFGHRVLSHLTKHIVNATLSMGYFAKKERRANMEKTDPRYPHFVQILREELVPAMGCTEPIAIAYGAAKAREIGRAHV